MEDPHDRGSNVRQHGLVRLKLCIGGLLTATNGAHLHHLPHVNVVTDRITLVITTLHLDAVT